MSFFHLHAHSRFSVLDGMPSVQSMVDKAVMLGQPALALTDHGNMSGAFQLYKACKKADIIPFIGEEFYLVTDATDKAAREDRFHIGLTALDYEGYQALVRLSSRSHQRDRFHRKPLIDFTDLIDLWKSGATKHIAATTGCFFGMPIQTLIRTGDDSAARSVVKLYRQWFPHLFVEVQRHDTPITTENKLPEDVIVQWSFDCAEKLGLPVIITQDAHYCDLSDKPLHDLMKRLGYHGGKSDEVERDWTFPGDGYHLARASWVKDHYSQAEWDRSLASYDELLRLNKLAIPFLDKYQYHVPPVHPAPLRYITRRCEKAMDMLGLRTPAYKERLAYELGVIEQLGMADYFVLVGRIVDYCRDNGIRVSARGSASGSIVAYLLGITQLDPVKWKLMFERFLSPTRTVPPDIDLDIDQFGRPQVLEWMAEEFDTMPIGTYGTLRQDEESGRGSIFVLWLASEKGRIGKEEFERKYGFVRGMYDLPPKVQKQLMALNEFEAYKHHGTHACGIVVSSDQHPIDGIIPSMLVASGGHTVTQMVAEDVEAAGFLKVDVLGLRGEGTIARTLEMLGYEPNDEMRWIPLNDRKVFAMLREGRTSTGVFTFEGYTQAKGCREVGVKSVEDMILVNALYRPATINSGYVRQYLHNRKDPSSIRYMHPVFKEAFGSTYGVPVYQEQVLTLLRLIGMDNAELDTMLKAIKASNHKVAQAAASFSATEARFRDLCEQAGMTTEQSAKAYASIQEFSNYSFNRAHAAEYAIRGYQMAWLKVNHPLEFHAALLETCSMAGADEVEYIREVRRLGIRLLPADVMVSNAHWTRDEKAKAIRRGLSSIKGIGDAIADGIVAARPFSTLDEMIEGAKQYTGRYMGGGKDWLDSAKFSGAIATLKEAGALASLGHGKG